MAALVSLAGIFSLRLGLIHQAFENKSLTLAPLLAFVTWTAASALWSPYPDHAQAPKLIALVLLGLAMIAGCGASPQSRGLTRAAGWAAFAVLALLLGIEAGFGMPLNQAAAPAELADWQVERNPARGTVVLLAMTWPVAAWAASAKTRAGFTWAGLALIVGGALAAQFHQTANLLGFAAGLGAFALAFFAPRIAPILVCSGLALWLLTAPFLTPLLLANAPIGETAPIGIEARAAIWNYVSAQILEQPWLGHGLDASRVVTDQIELRGQMMDAIPLHPHSASLQIWYETGAIGAVLAAAALFAGGVALARWSTHRPGAAIGGAGAIAALGVIANVSYGIWQEWWVATLLFSAALAAAARATKA